MSNIDSEYYINLLLCVMHFRCSIYYIYMFANVINISNGWHCVKSNGWICTMQFEWNLRECCRIAGSDRIDAYGGNVSDARVLRRSINCADK